MSLPPKPLIWSHWNFYFGLTHPVCVKQPLLFIGTPSKNLYVLFTVTPCICAYVQMWLGVYPATLCARRPNSICQLIIIYTIYTALLKPWPLISIYLHVYVFAYNRHKAVFIESYLGPNFRNFPKTFSKDCLMSGDFGIPKKFFFS